MTMSADSEKVRDILAEQLASFDDRLHATADDVDMLAEIQEGIGSLLSSSPGSEKEIRRVLQDRYEEGALRKETFQLVKSMLDRYVTERIPTAPTPDDEIPVPVDPPLDPPDFNATQKIDMGEVMNGDPIIDLGPLGAPTDVDKAFSEEEAAIPLTTDFDPLIAEDNGPAIAAPDIRNEAESVASDSDDDQFGSTTVIPGDVLKDTTADMRVQVGSLLRDRFLLQEKIAGGSMGVVYKALDRRLAEAGSQSQWVAIKVLSPKLAENAHALRALQQEAAKGRCLIHDHIVRFIDLDRDEDLYFIVMEWMEGRTLADILDSKDRHIVDLDAAFRIVRQIGDALAYAHRCGIVHADIKPGNIMIAANGDAKLFDFGVARVQQNRGDDDFDPGVLGAMTPAYSSMQVLTGDEPVASDDVFSLACLLYRLVAGYRVYGPRNAAEASQEGMKPQRVKGFSDAQWSALKKALSYSRVTRFESVEKFLDALDDTGPETVSLELPGGFGAEPERRTRKWPWLIALLLVAGAVVAWQKGTLDPYIEQWLPGNRELPRTREDHSPALPDPLASDDATTNAFIEDEETSADSTTNADVKDIATEAAADIAETIVPPEPDHPDTVGPASSLIDWSTLPEPTMIIPISLHGPGETATLFVREDAAPAIVEFVRDGDLTTELTLRLEEVGFSGNRSPWGTGQYALSNAGVIYFPVGQERGRVTLTMAPDQMREPDQNSTLRVREREFVDSELATIEVILEDDDQRAFEARLSNNTVAFASGQTTVSETDPAVQIDLVRFNPDDAPLVVRFSVHDVTAQDGSDYFAPGSYEIAFGPRQRSARLLIPLVQDAEVEGNETFVVELESGTEDGAASVNQSITVLIRDDDPLPVE